MRKIQLTTFDYKAVARLDMAMWTTYYSGNRGSIKLLTQAFKLIKLELGFSWIATIMMAYYTARAALYYRLKKRDENYKGAKKYLVKLFRVVSNNCAQPFDYNKTAQLELEWWDIERYPSKHEESLSNALADNMACLFNVTAKSMEDYGVNRALAIRLTSRLGNKNLESSEIYDNFEQAWRSLHLEIQPIKRSTNNKE